MYQQNQKNDGAICEFLFGIIKESIKDYILAPSPNNSFSRISVITTFADRTRVCFVVRKYNSHSRFDFIVVSTKDTSIMAHVLEQRFVIFFTRSILPRSHFEKNFIKYFLPFNLKHNLKIWVCESWTFHYTDVLWVPLCPIVSIYTTYNLKVKSIWEYRLMESRAT